MIDQASKVYLGAMLLGVSLFLGASARAHHSGAMYDDHKTVTLKGTVAKFEWSNPHVYVYLQPLGADKGLWEVECSPPSILKRLGWNQDTVHVGDTLEITGAPLRDQSKKGLLPSQIRHGDTVLFDRKGEIGRLAKVDETSAATHGHRLDGVWVTALAVKVEALLDPDKLALTPKGKKAAHNFDEKTMHPGAQCVPYPSPMFMTTPDLKRITTVGNTLLIDGEFDGAQRTIRMDQTSHEAMRSVQGDSIGHWEGDTLVIDTVQFSDHALGNGYGVPSGAGKHLVERMALDADGKKLHYHFELTDIEYLAKPVSADADWIFRPDLQYAALKCDPENAARYRH
jgi:hypothetical protein